MKEENKGVIGGNVKILDESKWPHLSQMTLDNSQLKAVKGY